MQQSRGAGRRPHTRNHEVVPKRCQAFGGDPVEKLYGEPTSPTSELVEEAGRFVHFRLARFRVRNAIF